MTPAMNSDGQPLIRLSPRVAPVAAPPQIWRERSRVVAAIAPRKNRRERRCLVLTVAATVAVAVAVAVALPWRTAPINTRANG